MKGTPKRDSSGKGTRIDAWEKMKKEGEIQDRIIEKQHRTIQEQCRILRALRVLSFWGRMKLVWKGFGGSSGG